MGSRFIRSKSLAILLCYNKFCNLWTIFFSFSLCPSIGELLPFFLVTPPPPPQRFAAGFFICPRQKTLPTLPLSPSGLGQHCEGTYLLTVILCLLPVRFSTRPRPLFRVADVRAARSTKAPSGTLLPSASMERTTDVSILRQSQREESSCRFRRNCRANAPNEKKALFFVVLCSPRHLVLNCTEEFVFQGEISQPHVQGHHTFSVSIIFSPRVCLKTPWPGQAHVT